ncbi:MULTISPECIES: hypothetical protein [unclassified Marinobacter]|uniref:hypothetical protein n=1 Tax=unclassified Marinobacter TaxID=83889 RepID=UPI0026E2064D|nr:MULTISPECIES: hypothetical protein [unclassified Marinobacter]MDO6443608.1 hypothetical protein [Marinobacter sp. 2_MG-2023]MDO6825461.1 hypothetical protein [Marinobacter sp. 1_MG-2023]
MENNSDMPFSLVIGGPFYRLQKKLGLLDEDLLPSTAAAAIFVGIVWLPLALLSVAEGSGWNQGAGGSGFFQDYSEYARFIIAVFTLTIMERIADRRTGIVLRQFLNGEVIDDNEYPRFCSVLKKADERSSSNRVEFLLLILAFVASVNGAQIYLSTMGDSWFGAVIDGSLQLTLAGWWGVLVSLPFVWFLMLRWIYRFSVWTVLLKDISRLKLRLVATHPDKCGGIGFLALFPTVFSMMVFALSCVTAAVVLQDVVYSGASLQWAGAMFCVWMAVILVVFIGPLILFYPALYQFKIRALIDYGAVATRKARASEAEWDVSCLADLSAGYEAIRSIHTVPVSWATFIALITATAIPWLAVLLSQVPLLQLLSTLAKIFV